MNQLPEDFFGTAAALELARRAGEAQGQLRMLPDLTLGLLHKLNNVMTSVYFTAEVCEADVERDHPAHPMIAELTRTLRNAQQLITQTADLNTTLGATEATYHDLNALLQQELFLVKILLPKSAIVEVETFVEPVFVRVSIADFRRILFSLAMNAYDAASEQPRVSLQITEVKNLDREAYEPVIAGAVEEMVALRFTDNGHGMTPEIVGRAFSPFFTTRKDRLGLGLFQAQQIAIGSGGKLAIRRSVPAGAEVAWILPRVTE